MSETEREAIVRELADRGPFTDTSGWCSFCAFEPGVWGAEHHESSCLWRKAKALYPEAKG